jgi:oligosaccharide repeat unit polymerase
MPACQPTSGGESGLLLGVVIGLALLLYINWRLTGSLLSPACLFSLTWGLAVAGLLASGDSLYPITGGTALIFLFGASAFSLGAILACHSHGAGAARRSAPASPLVHALLDAGLLVVVLSFPAYWRHVMANVTTHNPMLVLMSVRQEAITTPRGGTFSFMANLVTLALFTALAMANEDDGSWGRRWRTVVAVLAALAYGTATGTKGNAITLIIALFVIASLRQGRIKGGQLITTFLVALFLFAAGLRMINYGYMTFATFGELRDLLMESVQSYWLGGLVGFDRIVTSPIPIEVTHRLFRFFWETANSLGAHILLPAYHAPFTDISKTGFTNVYTIYYSYYRDYGVIGIAVGLSLMGYLIGVVYSYANRGSASATVLYGLMAVSVLLSIAAEQFLLGLNLLVKIGILLALLYGVAGRWQSARRLPVTEGA